MGKPNTISIKDVFGRLTVIATADPYIDPKTNRKRARFLCKCECGNEKVVSCSDLSSGRVKSCGCLVKDSASKVGKSNLTHGLSKTKVMQSYYNMCAKCTDENIPMDESWKGPDGSMNFYDDMSSGYSEGLRLTRIDPSIGYFRENCIWGDRFTTNGYSNAKLITNENSTYSIAQWTRILGYTKNKISDRLHNGWSEHEALFGKPESKNIINGVYFLDEAGNPISMDNYLSKHQD